MPENPYLRDDGSNVLSDAWDDGYAAGYAAAKPPGYVVQTQAEVDRLLNEAEALRIERDAAREDLAACRQFAADHVERAARQNIVARVANGPYTLLVTGDSYEQILESAEAWVEGREGRRFTPTYYTALTSVLWRGVVGTIDEEEGVSTFGTPATPGPRPTARPSSSSSSAPARPTAARPQTPPARPA